MTTPVHTEPCHHVKRYVEGVASGKRIRWWNILGWLHVKHCPKCQEALALLQSYLKSASDMRQEASEDVSGLLSRMSDAMTEVDQNSPSPF